MERRIHKSKLRLSEHPFRYRPFGTGEDADRQPRNIFWLALKGGREMTLVHRIGVTMGSLFALGLGLMFFRDTWECFIDNNLIWIALVPLSLLCTGLSLMTLHNVVFRWPARSQTR